VRRSAHCRAAGRPGEYPVVPWQRAFRDHERAVGWREGREIGLTGKAAAPGAEVALLEGPGIADVATLAWQAVEDGADLLGAAGSHGTQALVAGIAADRDIPMMVILAGTRNHFALDLRWTVTTLPPA
jgi:hypothetical protein